MNIIQLFINSKTIQEIQFFREKLENISKQNELLYQRD